MQAAPWSEDSFRKEGAVGGSFKANYSKHDVLETYLRGRLEWYGFTVEAYGIDKRHTEDAITDDKPDLRVKRNSETVGYIEVKSKSSEEWMGKLNLRHFKKYLYGDDTEDDPFVGAQSASVPVYLFFGVVDVDASTLSSELILPVLTESQMGNPFTVHGNKVVQLNLDDDLQWDAMVERLLSEVSQ